MDRTNQPKPDSQTPAGQLPANPLAAAYQPRRVWAAAISIAWNLAFAVGFLFTGAADRLYRAIAPANALNHAALMLWIVPIYLAVYFAAWSLWNFPVELWFGYLEERQFGLAKEGIRAWARDWLIGIAQNGAMFLAGSSMIIALQILAPQTWLAWTCAALLAIFLASSTFAVSLIPPGLFQLERADGSTIRRLESLLGDSANGAPVAQLPPVWIFSAPNQRDFNGGLVGLGKWQALLLSRSTLDVASDEVLRFVLLHEMGHRRHHHLLLSTLAGWAAVSLGLAAATWLIPQHAIGSPVYAAWLAVILSFWMALGEPALAYLGRRLEYQADRFYLRHGGTSEQMQRALDELCRRNLARTERLQRRQTIFHPLPSVANRLYAGRRYEQALASARPSKTPAAGPNGES